MKPTWSAAFVVMAACASRSPEPLPDMEPARPAAPLPASEGPLPRELTLEDALRLALERSPRARAARIEVAAGRQALEQAGLWRNPSLITDYRKDTRGDGETLLFRVTETFDVAGKRGLRSDLAGKEVEIASHRLDAELRDLVGEVRARFLKLIYLRDVLDLHRRWEKTASELSDAQAKRLEQGDISRVDFHATLISQKEISLRLREAASRLARARIELAGLLAAPEAHEFEIKGTLPGVRPLPGMPREALRELAARNRPDLRLARARVEAGELEAALARRNWIPDITLGPTYRIDLDQDQDEWGIRLGFDIPVLNFNQGEARRMAALAQLASVESEAARLKSIEEIEALYEGLLSLDETLGYYDREIRPLLREGEDALAKAVAAGDLDPFRALQLRQEYRRAELSELELVHRHAALRDRLEVAIGKGLD